MKPLDSYCALLFHEVALEPGLQYNRKLDMFEGFEDYGGSERKASFADHALVFMLRGICRKWKQPIVFTFCKGTTSTPRLTSLLMDVILQVKLTGLKIMCTICDQGATNQATINSLLRETEQNCIRQSIDNRHFGFVIDGEEIIPLYDFPHLLKGVRNNLLAKDLHFVQDGIEKMARWRHIEQFYLSDKADHELRLCPID
ncbi:hypothetical protein ILUMI_15779 [Ignelater luminosus]|uniref:Transposable element P transposase-like RNase H domain-containing protein n=1 Tax=Ignelater luminosus TaxID=2038154 RepID=A0A8K0CMY8_IGNLU|nr:hypothetical protein ILUMI_15779 [Ignelater luminosus]